jgi:hypothetical protein
LNQVIFVESELAHADRLGVSLAYVRTRRKLLVASLGGAPASDRDVGYLPAQVRQASTATLLATLDVCVARNEPSATGADITVAPATAAVEPAP